MKRRFPWNRLGIDDTHDTAAIRKAYADALRALNVDEDIAGYAELRRARDEALWLAAQRQREGAGENGFGLGDLADDGAEGRIEASTRSDDLITVSASIGDLPPASAAIEDAAVAAEYMAEDRDEVEVEVEIEGEDEDWDDDEWDWNDSADPYHPDPVARAAAAELNEAQTRAQAAWQGLLAVLYPGGAASDAAVSPAERDEGLTHLTVLLYRAAEADLVEHDALDDALAELFAATWPRSAPFVEPASAAFHWLDEAGTLEERPPLMFLNQRLRGMRFHEKVQLPEHPLNPAWRELSRPGRATVLDRLRVKRLEIDTLLTGIRDRYPEVEGYLDAGRVASWEGSGEVGSAGPRIVRWIAIVVVGVAVLRLIPAFTDPRPDAPLPAVLESGSSAAEIDAEVAQIFGDGVTMQNVRTADPVFADQLRRTMGSSPAAETPLAFTRLKALAAAEIAKFDALVARTELRRLWLAAALRLPGEQAQALCQNINAGDFTSVPLTLTDAERARERVLLRQLLDAGLLSHLPKGESFTYAIPGWLVGDILTRSGLSEAAVRSALKDSKDANRCMIDRALLDGVLANPGRVSPDLLKGV